jgi:hypothetical protein
MMRTKTTISRLKSFPTLQEAEDIGSIVKQQPPPPPPSNQNSSDHTASTAAMSTCWNLSEKSSAQSSLYHRSMDEKEFAEEDDSTRKEEDFVTATISPPLKMRKTQSLLAPSSFRALTQNNSERWNSEATSSPHRRRLTKDDLLSKPSRKTRSNIDSLLFEKTQPMDAALRSCLSSSMIRRVHTMGGDTMRSSAKESFGNASFVLTDSDLIRAAAARSQQQDPQRDQDQEEAANSKKKEAEKLALQKRLALLYEHALDMIEDDELSSSKNSKDIKNSTSTGSLLLSSYSNHSNTGPPQFPRRQTFSNLQAIDEGAGGGMDASMREEGAAAAAGIDNSLRIDDLTDSIEGTVVEVFQGSKASFVSVLSTDSSIESSSKQSTSSHSMRMSAVFNKSPSDAASPSASSMRKTGNGSMASVFANIGALTAEQQAKLEELRRITALQNGTTSQRARQSPNRAMGRPLLGHAATAAAVSPSPLLSLPPKIAAQTTKNMFAGFVSSPDAPGMPNSNIVSPSYSFQSKKQLNRSSPTPRQTKSSRSSSKPLDIPPRSPQRSPQKKLSQEVPRSLDAMKDCLPTIADGQPPIVPLGNKRMPFGYKTKSTNGLFGSSTTSAGKTPSPTGSRNRISDAAHHQQRRTPSRDTLVTTSTTGTNSIMGKTRTGMMRQSHSWLERPPVKGEQLATMKALLLGQAIPSAGGSSSSTKKSLSRAHQFSSSPALSSALGLGPLRQSSDLNFSRKKHISPSTSGDGIAQSIHISTSTSALNDNDNAAGKMIRRQSPPVLPIRKRDSGDRPEPRAPSGPLPKLSGRHQFSVGSAVSPEAVAMSALILRGAAAQADKSMTRGSGCSGSGTRMGKPQASLGQLKRSRLSLANMKDDDNVEQEVKNGGMNFTFESNERIPITSPLLKADNILSPCSDNSMLFGSVASPSLSRKSAKSSHIMDLDSKFLSRRKSDKAFQSGSMVDLMALTPRNKSDLKKIVFGSSCQLSSSIPNDRQQVDSIVHRL